jgi:ATP-binding cassette subfamily B protein
MDNYPVVTAKIIFKEYWKGIKPRKRMFWFCIFAFIMVHLIEIIVPLFYKDFFDALGGESPTADALIRIITIIAVMHLASWIMYAMAFFSLTTVSAKVMAKLKQNAFDHLMLHSRDFFVNNFSGSLVQKVNRFSRSFEALFDILVFNIIPMTVTAIGSIIVTAFVAPVISLIIVLWAFDHYFQLFLFTLEIKI